MDRTRTRPLGHGVQRAHDRGAASQFPAADTGHHASAERAVGAGRGASVLDRGADEAVACPFR
jgi:hypothetical protein